MLCLQSTAHEQVLNVYVVYQVKNKKKNSWVLNLNPDHMK